MVNHTVYRGDTANFTVSVKDSYGAEQNITGWTFVLSGARKPGGTIAFSANGTIQDALNGIVSFQLNPEQTSAVGIYFYDVQALTSSSEIRTVESGKITVIQDVTDAKLSDLGGASFRISATGHQIV